MDFLQHTVQSHVIIDVLLLPKFFVLSALALSSDGNFLAAGAPHSEGENNSGFWTGEVRLFEYNPSIQTWDLRGDPIYGEEEFDLFGSSLSMSSNGHIVVIGAPGSRNSNFQGEFYLPVLLLQSFGKD